MKSYANQTYGDSVFRDLFGSPERKSNALELYNALNGSSYSDPDELELTTLEDVLYYGVKNDVSFLLEDEIVLWEHQSTPNPNMPLRGLGYFARLYSAVVERIGANMYGTRLIELPTPRYVVLYVGAARRPERETLRLSDSFSGDAPSLEVTCEVVNINPGMNAQIVGASPTLAGYTRFVDGVREYNKVQKMPLEDAIDATIRDCISEGVLEDYLRIRRAEVFDMFLTDYDEQRQRELDRADWLEQGIEQGRADFLGRAAQKVSSGALTLAEASDIFGFSEDEIRSAI